MRATLVFPAGLLMASPALWDAFTGRLGVDVALQRLLIALLIAAVGASIVSALTRVGASPQPVTEAHEGPRRRRTDEDAPVER